MKCIAPVFFLFLFACAAVDDDRNTFEQIDADWQVIMPEYCAYLESDARLYPIQREQRMDLVRDISRLLNLKVRP
jgi:hypothetical protein